MAWWGFAVVTQAHQPFVAKGEAALHSGLKRSGGSLCFPATGVVQMCGRKAESEGRCFSFQRDSSCDALYEAPIMPGSRSAANPPSGALQIISIWFSLLPESASG